MSKLFINNYKTNILGVSGFTRSGKAMLMKLISTFENVSKSNTDIMLEQIHYLHKIKKISTEVAIYLIRKNINISLFYNEIGRDTNYKINDFSSAHNYHNPNLYLKKTQSKKKKCETVSNKYLYQIMLHNGLNSGKLLMNVYKSLKIIEIYKNPVELIFSWIKKNYGKDIYNKPNVYLLTIKYKKKMLPFYAKGWEEKYLKMSHHDRCAKMIFNLFDDRKNQINKLSAIEKKRLLNINFDNLINNPHNEIKNISKFIKRKPTKKTFLAFKDEKIPRKSFQNDYNKKVKFLKKNLSKKYFNKLLNYEKNYLKQFNYEK